MRIIIVRHAEPDYANDTITSNGQIEAMALSKRLLKENIDYVYCSPLKRALDTAKYYLDESKKDYKVLKWLEEFKYPIKHDTGEVKIPWDFHIDYLSSFNEAYSMDLWETCPFFENTEVVKGYKYVCDEFDKLLEKHGYVRHGKYYNVKDSNKKTLILFCHLGVESVLLSHLASIPYMLIAQSIAFAPSSVSIIYSEERTPGIAQFRAQCLGDLSHLYANGIKPSFMGRYRECANDPERS